VPVSQKLPARLTESGEDTFRFDVDFLVSSLRNREEVSWIRELVKKELEKRLLQRVSEERRAVQNEQRSP
jgi:hypothetical protein